MFLHSLLGNVAALLDALSWGSFAPGSQCWLTGYLSSVSHIQTLVFCPPASSCTQFNLEQCWDVSLLPELSPCCPWHVLLISELNPEHSYGSEDRSRMGRVLLISCSPCKDPKTLKSKNNVPRVARSSREKWDKPSGFLIPLLTPFSVPWCLLKRSGFFPRTENSPSSPPSPGSGSHLLVLDLPSCATSYAGICMKACIWESKGSQGLSVLLMLVCGFLSHKSQKSPESI